MARNTIAYIIGVIIIVAVLLLWFLSAGDDAVDTPEGADAEVTGTE